MNVVKSLTDAKNEVLLFLPTAVKKKTKKTNQNTSLCTVSTQIRVSPRINMCQVLGISHVLEVRPENISFHGSLWGHFIV